MLYSKIRVKMSQIFESVMEGADITFSFHRQSMSNVVFAISHRKTERCSWTRAEKMFKRKKALYCFVAQTVKQEC
jgi:hypothetical protein